LPETSSLPSLTWGKQGKGKRKQIYILEE
jgi:hypothetical protein